MALAEERQQVMFAQAEEFDVFHHHHLIEVNSEEGSVHYFGKVGLVAAGEILHRALPALRGPGQTFPGGIFTQQTEHLGHIARDLTLMGSRHLYKSFLLHLVSNSKVFLAVSEMRT